MKKEKHSVWLTSSTESVWVHAHIIVYKFIHIYTDIYIYMHINRLNHHVYLHNTLIHYNTPTHTYGYVCTKQYSWLIFMDRAAEYFDQKVIHKTILHVKINK